MDFAHMRDKVFEYCDFAGYADTNPPLDMAYCINEALRQISTFTEYNVEDTTVTTVASQAEYSLTAPPDWIRLTDVLYGTTQALYQSDENTERAADWLWTQQPASTPQRWWQSAPNKIRLQPKPDTSSITINIRGVREVGPLSLDSDTPAMPVRYHDAIPLLGAWLHLKKVAVGNEYQRATNYHKEAMERVAEFKEEMSNQTAHFRRTVQHPPQERVWLGGYYIRR